jgi:hypothetical protein
MEDFRTDHLPDLNSAGVQDKELNQYLGYPNPEDMLNHIMSSDGEVYEIDLEELSLNGKVVKDSMEEYLKSSFESSSSCKEALKTPLHYLYHKTQEIPKQPKKHFDLGTFAHMAFLEPELFEMVRVEPKADRSTIVGTIRLIEWYENLNELKESPSYKNWKHPELKEYLSDLIAACKYQIIDHEHKIIIDVLKKNYYRYGNGIIPKIMRGAMNEVSFYGTDSETGIPVKVRPDAFNVAENIGVNAVISFKTTSSDNIQKFIYDSAKYSYELSEGMYQEVISNITGREFKSTIMIMLQVVPPYLPAVLWWDADDLENGRYKYRNALLTIKECKDKDSFPGFDAMAENGLSGIIKMKQPDWTMKELHPVDIDQ